MIILWLTPEVKYSIDLLNKTRKAVGIPNENPFNICLAKQAVTRPHESMGLPAEICYGRRPTSVKPYRDSRYQTQKVFGNHFPSSLSQRNRGWPTKQDTLVMKSECIETSTVFTNQPLKFPSEQASPYSRSRWNKKVQKENTFGKRLKWWVQDCRLLKFHD